MQSIQLRVLPRFEISQQQEAFLDRLFALDNGRDKEFNVLSQGICLGYMSLLAIEHCPQARSNAKLWRALYDLCNSPDLPSVAIDMRYEYGSYRQARIGLQLQHSF